MEKTLIIVCLALLCIPNVTVVFAAGDNDPAPGTNNDNVRPKLTNVEIGNTEYTASANHIHDIHSPFSIYVWVDGYNELDDLTIDWNNVQVFLVWSYVSDGGTTYGPFMYELLSPTTVGTFKRYHFPIPDMDGDMDIYYSDINTYYPYDGDTKASFGGGTVRFYTYTQLITNSDIRCYYKYPAEQYNSNNQMNLIFQSDIEETGEAIEPQSPPLDVGLEDIPVIGPIVEQVAQGISDNPVLVPVIVGGIAGLILILFVLNRTGGFANAMRTIQGKQKGEPKKKPTLQSKIHKKQPKKKSNFFASFAPPPATVPVKRQQRKNNKKRRKRT